MAGSIRQPLPLPVAAERARRTERTIRNWIAKGQVKDAFIPDGRGGNLHVIWSDELDAFLHGATPEQLAELSGADQPLPESSVHNGNLTEHTRYDERMPAQSTELMTVPDRIRLADVSQQMDVLSNALQVLPAITERLDALTRAIAAGQGSEPAGQPELRAAVDALTTQVQALNDAQATARQEPPQSGLFGWRRLLSRRP